MKLTGTTATTALVDTKGSLNLLQENGVLLVQLRDQPHRVDTLSTARGYFNVDGVRLNGSQAVTVKQWFEEHKA